MATQVRGLSPAHAQKVASATSPYESSCVKRVAEKTVKNVDRLLSKSPCQTSCPPLFIRLVYAFFEKVVGFVSCLYTLIYRLLFCQWKGLCDTLCHVSSYNQNTILKRGVFRIRQPGFGSCMFNALAMGKKVLEGKRLSSRLVEEAILEGVKRQVSRYCPRDMPLSVLEESFESARKKVQEAVTRIDKKSPGVLDQMANVPFPNPEEALPYFPMLTSDLYASLEEGKGEGLNQEVIGKCGYHPYKHGIEAFCRYVAEKSEGRHVALFTFRNRTGLLILEKRNNHLESLAVFDSHTHLFSSDGEGAFVREWRGSDLIEKGAKELFSLYPPPKTKAYFSLTPLQLI